MRAFRRRIGVGRCAFFSRVDGESRRLAGGRRSVERSQQRQRHADSRMDAQLFLFTPGTGLGSHVSSVFTAGSAGRLHHVRWGEGGRGSEGLEEEGVEGVF